VETLTQIRTGDFFLSVDLKDAYFYIQVASHYRSLLMFAFKGVAYKFTVLPFGLSLAPCTLTKYIDATLSPLSWNGVHILHYLND